MKTRGSSCERKQRPTEGREVRPDLTSPPQNPGLMGWPGAMQKGDPRSKHTIRSHGGR